MPNLENVISKLFISESMAIVRITKEHHLILRALSYMKKNKEEFPVVTARIITKVACTQSPKSTRRNLDYLMAARLVAKRTQKIGKRKRFIYALTDIGTKSLPRLDIQRKMVDSAPAIFALVQAGLPTKLCYPVPMDKALRFSVPD